MPTTRCYGKLKNCFGHCLTKPSVIRDGFAYCWRHDPVRLTQEAKEKHQQRMAEIQRIDAEHDARIEHKKLIEAAGIAHLTDETLCLIAQAGGIEAVLEKQILLGSERGKLEHRIAGALRDCINAHGPITSEWVGSAAKRIIAVLKVWNHEHGQSTDNHKRP